MLLASAQTDIDSLAQVAVEPVQEVKGVETAIVRIYETHVETMFGFKQITAAIHVHRPGSEFEQIPLSVEGKLRGKNNLEKINKVLDDLLNEGYRMIGSSASGGETTSTTTWVFQRDP